MAHSLIFQAAKALRQGGVIAYPTEAVWGLGCDPENPEAVQRLLTIKQRPVAKGLILVAASIEQLSPYLTQLSQHQYQQLQASWPGFQTWVVAVPESVPEWIRGRHASLALRVSAHPLVAELCQAFGGPLVSTSANPAGQPAALTEQQVKEYFNDELAFVLSGELGGADMPSPIIELATGRVLR